MRIFQAGEAKLRHTLFAVEGKDGLVGPGVGVEQFGPDIERILSRYSTGLFAPTPQIVVNGVNPNRGKKVPI